MVAREALFDERELEVARVDFVSVSARAPDCAEVPALGSVVSGVGAGAVLAVVVTGAATAVGAASGTGVGAGAVAAPWGALVSGGLGTAELEVSVSSVGRRSTARGVPKPGLPTERSSSR